MVRTILWLTLAVCCEAVYGAGPPAPHYDLRVSLGPGADWVSGRAAITLSRERAGQEYRFLLARTMRVTRAESDEAEVRVENTDVPFPNALQAIIVRPRPGSKAIRVRVDYAGRLARLQSPPINSINPELIELSVDSFWLPFPHEFNAGMTATACIRGIPRDAAVVSTGTVTRRRNEVRIALTRPNDLAIIASRNLREARDGQLIFLAADPGNAEARIYRRHGQQGIAFLESLLGPLPGGVSRVVVVRRESRAGYSRPGYMVISERAEGSQEWSMAGDLVHEISHAWWSRGNFLSEDYWLVEGPANYYMQRYGLQSFGAEAMAASLNKSLERARKATAINGQRPNSDTAYAKGELLLRTLEQEIGHERFDRFMRDFVDEETHTTRGFLDMLGRHTDRSTAERFERRLRAPGFEG